MKKEDDHDSDCEDKTNLLFDRIKKVVEESNTNPILHFEELQRTCCLWEINQVDDSILLDLVTNLTKMKDLFKHVPNIEKHGNHYV